MKRPKELRDIILDKIDNEIYVERLVAIFVVILVIIAVTIIDISHSYRMQNRSDAVIQQYPQCSSRGTETKN